MTQHKHRTFEFSKNNSSQEDEELLLQMNWISQIIYTRVDQNIKGYLNLNKASSKSTVSAKFKVNNSEVKETEFSFAMAKENIKSKNKYVMIVDGKVTEDTRLLEAKKETKEIKQDDRTVMSSANFDVTSVKTAPERKLLLMNSRNKMQILMRNIRAMMDYIPEIERIDYLRTIHDDKWDPSFVHYFQMTGKGGEDLKRSIEELNITHPQ